jgi:hypothetical protein
MADVETVAARELRLLREEIVGLRDELRARTNATLAALDARDECYRSLAAEVRDASRWRALHAVSVALAEERLHIA